MSQDLDFERRSAGGGNPPRADHARGAVAALHERVSEPSRSHWSQRSLYWAKRAVLEIVLVALCITLAFTAEGFLTTDNLLNVLRNISIQGVVALGMTMVIIAGEIDLSVGSAV